MRTKADVIVKKDSCLQSIDNDIDDARTLQNASSQADSDRMEPKIADMRAQREAIAVQDYVGALADPAFKKAIDKIDAATADMKATAEIMRTVTGFIANVAGYVGAAGTVVIALRGA